MLDIPSILSYHTGMSSSANPRSEAATLGQTLKHARNIAGLSLRDVERASKGRLSNGHLSMLESDEVRQPSPHHLYLLSAILRLEYATLLRLAGYVLPGEAASALEPEAAAIAGKAADFTTAELDELENYVEYIRSKRPR